MHIKNKRGQSTVEYILLVTAVIAVIIALVTNKSGSLQSTLNTTINTAVSDIGNMSDRLENSRPLTPGNLVTNTTPPYSVNVTP